MRYRVKSLVFKVWGEGFRVRETRVSCGGRRGEVTGQGCQRRRASKVVGCDRVHNAPVLHSYDSASSPGTRTAWKVLGQPIFQLGHLVLLRPHISARASPPPLPDMPGLAGLLSTRWRRCSTAHTLSYMAPHPVLPRPAPATTSNLDAVNLRSKAVGFRVLGSVFCFCFQGLGLRYLGSQFRV